MAETQTTGTAVTAPDGRTILVHEAGDPAGRPLVVHHGSPSGGLFTEKDHENAAERGMRLIGFDRAGYGGSDRNPGRTVGDVAIDVTAIADALGVERFATWGSSGGGPHALACAALLGDRCAAAMCVSSLAPVDAEGLDWLAGMGADNVAEFRAATRGEAALVAHLGDGPSQLADVSAEELVPAIKSVLSGVDASVFTDALAVNWVRVLHHGLAPGAGGWIDDDLAFLGDWGFDLRAPRPDDVPVEIWHGRHDLMVPPAHGEWLAAHIPGASFTFFEEEGHVSLFERQMSLIYDAIARYTF
ncbi:MAG TPA: alpha/beta fold hydrolase [Baekduia sp.]